MDNGKTDIVSRSTILTYVFLRIFFSGFVRIENT